jgi:hypothetical protein
MNPRDLPAEIPALIIEMHRAHLGRKGLMGHLYQLAHTVEEGFKELQKEIRESSRVLVAGITRGLKPFRMHLPGHSA